MRPSLPARLILPIAAIKVALGLAAFLNVYEVAAAQSPKFPYSFHGPAPDRVRRDGSPPAARRPGRPAGARPRRLLPRHGGLLERRAAARLSLRRPGYGLLSLAQAVQPQAFLPYFLWAFVRDFPGSLAQPAPLQAPRCG